MVEVSKGVDRFGRDGKLQIPRTRGLKPGLNHLGWEMENEAKLVEAYRRARQSNVTIHRTVDHLISHSVYTSDPDGNGHEFYADAIKDWRTIYNLDHEDEVTAEWNPESKPASLDANFTETFEVRRVPDAVLHVSHVTDACFGTQRFSAMKDFFLDVGGLSVTREGGDRRRSVTFAGTLGRPDLTLIEVSVGDPIGLRSFSFALAEDVDYSDAIKRLNAKSVKATKTSEIHVGLSIQDPDGFNVNVYSPNGPLAAKRVEIHSFESRR
jgi:catechol 2,3-dioxygenase